MATPRDDWSMRVDRWRDVATLTVVLAGAAAIPLLFRRDPADMFRLVKAVAYRAEAILLVSITLAGYLLGAPLPRIKWRDRWLQLPLAAFAAMLLLTMTSTNRALSMAALASATATFVVFFATVAAARRHGWLLVAVPLAAAAGSALLVIVEELRLWMPFGVQPDISHHLQSNALIGNPNEVGSYLGAAALAGLAFITVRTGTRSTAWAVAGVVIIAAGLVASQTLTAIVAFAAGGIAMVAISSWKNALRTAAVGLALAAIVVALTPPLRARARNVVVWTSSGDYNAIFTERFTSFAAAWLMFVERPVTGVGPGVFAWQYYDYKLLAEQRYPSLRSAWNRGTNFGEVHNDHLQALAEGGIIGYAAFAVLLGSLAYLSFTIVPDAPDPRQRFARRLALSLAVFWIILSLTQFPLETTIVRSLLVHLAALCVGWGSQ